ncbi:hypothetical protein BB560_004059 [Smittium megazygosporum]|uniref:C3H1-type domain-containing protein n=1 Tax=Smittium megazygosporum TaxID=133381 RepID=A0A2T9ZAB5_9FUNG|nr:hypothetical protein BB560_005623 [Smittium megazygosporum]PVV01521.1 hypothetical protein BB560_004059 [Smittium megazygosporum]
MLQLEGILTDLKLDTEIVGRYILAALEDESISDDEKTEMLVEYLSSGEIQSMVKITDYAEKIIQNYSNGNLDLSKGSNDNEAFEQESKRKGLSLSRKYLENISAAKQAEIQEQIQSQIVDYPSPSSGSSSAFSHDYSSLNGTTETEFAGLSMDKLAHSSISDEDSTYHNPSNSYTLSNYVYEQNGIGVDKFQETTDYLDKVEKVTPDKTSRESQESVQTEFEIFTQVFKIISPQVIWDAFVISEFDATIVANLLLLLDVQALLNPSQLQTPNKRVCRFLLRGECYRSDCRFSHNLTSYICKFWLQGNCIKEDRCPYFHYWPVQLLAILDLKTDLKSNFVANQHVDVKPSLLSTKEFPSLASDSTKSGKKKLEKSSKGNLKKNKDKEKSKDLVQKPEDTKIKPIKLDPSIKEFVPRKSKVKLSILPEASFSPNNGSFSEISPSSSMFAELPPVNPYTSPEDPFFKEYFKFFNSAVLLAKDRNGKIASASLAYKSGNIPVVSRILAEILDVNSSVYNLYTEANNELMKQNYSHARFLQLYGFSPSDAIEILVEKIEKLKPETNNVFLIMTPLNDLGRPTQIMSQVLLYLQDFNYKFRTFSQKSLYGLVNVII